MSTIILTAQHLQLIVEHFGIDPLMDEMIDRLTHLFHDFDPTVDVTIPRYGFSYNSPGKGLIEWMPAMRAQKQMALKIVGCHPSNTALHNLPAILSTASVYDTASGHLVGLMDATFLTALRTGATSAVASRILARPDSSTLGLLGCGAQALTQLHALSRIFDFERVLMYDIESAQSTALPRRASCLQLDHLEMRATSLENLLSSSDIVCTTTTVDARSGPVFEDKQTSPWIHINAVGADSADKQELPQSLLRQCFVCPDYPEQAIKEGECQQLDPSEIGPSLVDIVRHPESFRHVQQQRSVFDSTGWALEDQVAMDMFLNYARELGLGTEMQIESTSLDAKNPYDFLSEMIQPQPAAISE